MSRNFELMQRLQAEHAFSDVLSAEAHKAGYGIEEDGACIDAAPAEVAYEAAGLGEVVERSIAEFVQRVFLSAREDAPRRVLFCSVDEKAQTGSLALATGEALCASGRGPICLVDANVAAPSLDSRLSISNERGLTTALRGSDGLLSCALRLKNREMTIITAGPKFPAWQALLSSDIACTRLRELGRSFACVLIEAPAFAESKVATALARATDGVVLVVEADETRRELALKAKQELLQAGARILGAVLNNRKFPIPQALYTKL